MQPLSSQSPPTRRRAIRLSEAQLRASNPGKHSFCLGRMPSRTSYPLHVYHEAHPIDIIIVTDRYLPRYTPASKFPRQEYNAECLPFVNHDPLSPPLRPILTKISRATRCRSSSLHRCCHSHRICVSSFRRSRFRLYKSVFSTLVNPLALSSSCILLTSMPSRSHWSTWSSMNPGSFLALGSEV